MIYFFQPEGYPVVKIGYAADLQKRLAYFRSAHWVDFKVVRAMRGGREAEQWLHAHFADQKIRSEWFNFIPEMLTVKVDLNKSLGRLSVIRAAIASGMNYSEIADALGISRERVRQLCRDIDIVPETARSVATPRAAAKRQAIQERRAARLAARAALARAVVN